MWEEGHREVGVAAPDAPQHSGTETRKTHDNRTPAVREENKMTERERHAKGERKSRENKKKSHDENEAKSRTRENANQPGQGVESTAQAELPASASHGLTASEHYR